MRGGPIPSIAMNAMWLLLGLTGLSLTACGPYQLQGKVVMGRESMVEVVGVDDPRLKEEGIGGAVLQLTLDPQSLGRKNLDGGTSRGDGTFSIPISEFGAGALNYQLGIVVRAKAHNSALGTIELPSGLSRVLITLAPGADLYKPPKGELDDFQPFLDPRRPPR